MGAATGEFTIGFGLLRELSATSGFVSVINTLTFTVTNSAGPTALRVDNIALFADPMNGNVIPEPAS